MPEPSACAPQVPGDTGSIIKTVEALAVQIDTLLARGGVAAGTEAAVALVMATASLRDLSAALRKHQVDRRITDAGYDAGYKDGYAACLEELERLREQPPEAAPPVLRLVTGPAQPSPRPARAVPSRPALARAR